MFWGVRYGVEYREFSGVGYVCFGGFSIGDGVFGDFGGWVWVLGVTRAWYLGF